MTRIAQAGVGQWGKNLARNLAELGELVWLCDVDERTLVTIAERYPRVRTTTRFDEMIADESIDAVVVATPSSTHYELARRALEAGKHVFVEKPPAMRGAEMEDLYRLAEERSRVLMPGPSLALPPSGAKTKRDRRVRRAW